MTSTGGTQRSPDSASKLDCKQAPQTLTANVLCVRNYRLQSFTVER